MEENKIIIYKMLIYDKANSDNHAGSFVSGRLWK